MVWMLAALGAECQTKYETWADFRPDASATTWETPGGWDKRRLREFPAHRVALAELEKSAFKRFPIEIQDALLNGELPDVDGLGEVALKMAYGPPDLFWDTEAGCRALLYNEERQIIDTCRGEVVARTTLTAPIPCERLDAVVPRLNRGALARFESTQRLELLAGVAGPWMDDKALQLAFGKPREKSKTTRTYYDDRGLDSGVTVQMADGFAASWSYPDGAPVIAIESVETLVEPEPQMSDIAVSTPPEPDEEKPPPVAVSSLEVYAPTADLAPGEQRLRGTCGAASIAARVTLGGDSFSITSRMGEHGALEVFRTKGKVRGSEAALTFDGVGSGVVDDDGLTLTLASWPKSACSGAVLTPE